MIPNFKMGYYHQKDNIRPCQIGESVKKPMGFEYTSLISNKTYSILSYIVGGFVGSKSQMNNEKHLSYDLSTVIFNLLHPQKMAKIPKENNYCSRLNYEKYYQKSILKKQAVDLAFSLFGQNMFAFDEYCDKLSLSQRQLGVTKAEDVTDRAAVEATRKNSLAARFRQRSESSIESTDSESFIVFDDQSDEKKDEWLEVEFESEDDNDEDDDDEDDVDDEEDDDCSCDEYELYSAERELAQVNSKWSKNYEDVVQRSENPKKVRFSDDVKINKIIAWEYAYRAARLGPWEQFARDRVRFQERILRLSSVLSPVLERDHREKIYKELYS